MNEQIKEFLVKARVQDRGYFIYQYGGTTGHQSIEKAIDLEKFAELIVRECVTICNSVQEQYGQYTFTATTVKNRIQEHFGINK